MDSTSGIQSIEEDGSQKFFIKYFRETAGAVYLIIVLFDFLVAPVLTAIYYAYTKQLYAEWTPLTLQGGGMFHISFATILGISSYMKGVSSVETIRNMPDYSNYPYNRPSMPMPYNPSGPVPYNPSGPVPYNPGASATITTSSLESSNK